VDKLRSVREKLGLGLDGFEIRAGLRGRLTAERVESLAAAGVTSLIIGPWQVTTTTSIYGHSVRIPDRESARSRKIGSRILCCLTSETGECHSAELATSFGPPGCEPDTERRRVNGRRV